MINDRMKKIEESIDVLTLDLLVPLRTSKSINRVAFDELYTLFDELKILLKGEKSIDRKLPGLMFFIYTSVAAEAEHAHYTNPIFIEVARLEGYLDQILWDSPFGKENKTL